MKSSLIFAVAGATFVAAQFPDGFPQCGMTCVNNMLGQAQQLGCNNGDYKCMCANTNFVYGIRDCAYQHCQNDTAAAQVVQFGTAFCSGQGVTVPASATVNPVTTTSVGAGTGSGTSTTGTGGASGSGSASASSSGTGSAGGAVSSAAITTSPIVTVITTDGSTITSTLGSTTIFGGSPSAIATSAFTTVITSGGSTLTSTGITTISGLEGVSGATSLPATAVTTSALVSTVTSGSSTFVSTTGSTVVSSALTGSALTSALSSQASAATSSALAPVKTVAPAGLLAAAGIAALLL